MATDLIIDGYNLLHATGIVGRGGPGGLERSRRALLGVLCAALEPDQRARTTVVFDAGRAGRGLPHSTDQQGLQVRYAAQHEDADALIEQLIRLASAPRRLIVVSSDRRVQRAARRRRATAVASDRWFAHLLARRRRRQTAMPPERTKPAIPLTDTEVQYWLAEFGLSDSDVPPDQSGPEIDHPFPPGYAEDLLDELDDRSAGAE
jgi:predicted RNA-binding protein with PIN domain